MILKMKPDLIAELILFFFTAFFFFLTQSHKIYFLFLIFNLKIVSDDISNIII